MKQRPIPFLAVGLILLGLLIILAGYALRPITIRIDGGNTISFRQPVWTVGQALAIAGVTLDPADQVDPAADKVVPFNGEIRVRHAVQVYLWENGAVRHIGGLEQKPALLLEQAGIQLSPADRLLRNGEPVDPELPLPAGIPVVLQLERARPVRVIDGSGERTIHTHGPTAARALWEAGIRPAPGDRFSVPLGSALEENSSIAYQPARLLTIQIEGQTVLARSSADTVGEALGQAGIALQGLDYSQPAESQPVPENGQIRVTRVREEIVLKETFTAYERKTETDPNLELDQRKVTSPGQMGVQVTRERVRYEDGQEVMRKVDSDWTASEPVTETVGIGSKVVPHTADTPDGTIEYYRAVQVYATSYSPCQQGMDHCSWSTASGMRLAKGVIGTSLSWFRMFRGQRVYVTGYGYGVIGDYGGISGMWIDLGFDEEDYQHFSHWVTMYFLTPAPANVPLTLP